MVARLACKDAHELIEDSAVLRLVGSGVEAVAVFVALGQVNLYGRVEIHFKFVIALLQQLQEFTGKIAPFSTGWSDTGDYQEDFINYAGKLNVTSGYHILTHGSPAFNKKSLFSWLRKL